jgi:glucosylceramidase
VLLWNLALDTQHGPHLGGCTNCRGLVTVDSATGRITRNEEYYALAHASRFVRRGAVRIGSTLTQGDTSTFAQVAFQQVAPTPGGSHSDGTLVVIAANAADGARSVRVTGGAATWRVQMPPRSVATIVLP